MTPFVTKPCARCGRESVGWVDWPRLIDEYAGEVEKVGPENRPGWKVSRAAPPIGHDTVTPSPEGAANPHARAENEGVKQGVTHGGGDTFGNGWTPEAAGALIEQAKQTFPGSYEVAQ